MLLFRKSPIYIQRLFLQTTNNKLAGHSKWANIRHIKAQKDGEKSVLFTKLSRQIRLAVQDGGSNPELNSTLKSAIEEALRKNMTQSTIQSTIKKVSQSKDTLKRYRIDVKHKQKVYAVLILYTDNLNSFKMELSTALKKTGCSYVDAGHFFEDFGLIECIYEKPDANFEDRVDNDALECNAEDFEIVDLTAGSVNFICRPIDINKISKMIEAKGYQIQSKEHVYKPKVAIQLEDDEMKGYEAFLTRVRKMPGLEEVYDNVHYDDDVSKN